MFEVEAKVPISKGEFEQLEKRLRKEAEYLGTRAVADTYYANPKNAFIRIRKRGGDYSFDIKRRQTIEGVESNIEMEWEIKDIGKWRTLLKKLRINPTIKKNKKSILFRKNNFIIELNHVRLLGHYLEIERVVSSKMDVPRAKRELLHLFSHLGYSRRQFEPRPYLELLSHV